jgi:chromate transporter
MSILWSIFFLFTRVALFSWGGGQGSLALMQRETTTAGWVTPEEFADGVAVGNALPGPIAPQVSAFIGYKLAGTAGAVVAVIGTVVPATILMLVMVTFFFGIKDSPTMKAILGGLRPVVVGLLIWTAYDIARSVFDADSKGWGAALMTGWDKILFIAVTFVLLNFTKVNPIFIIVGAAGLGFVLYR